MYNQWALQQVAAIQFAAQQLQQQQQFIGQQIMMPTRYMQAEAESEDDDDEDDEQNRTLFCANLDDRVTEELLYEVFVQAGPIESVRIPKDAGGRQRTFGFITYMHQCTAPYAIQLYQGLALFRKSLTIKYQGSNSTQTTQPQRRSLPSDCEPYQSRRSDGSNTNSPSNPFKQESDYTLGGNAQERISKHSSGQLRPHQNAAPYQRRSGGDAHDRGRDHQGNDYKRRHHGNNRRSEQRNNSRR